MGRCVAKVAAIVTPVTSNGVRGTRRRGRPMIVVIPTVNERDNIRTLIPEVLAQDAEIEVLVVDDRATSKIPTTSGGYGRWFDRDAVAERLGCLPCTN